MKKLASLKGSTLKSNIIAENNLRNVTGGIYKTLVGRNGDFVLDNGLTGWGDGVFSKDVSTK